VGLKGGQPHLHFGIGLLQKAGQHVLHRRRGMHQHRDARLNGAVAGIWILQPLKHAALQRIAAR
jgi:hypothetical protein